MGSIISILAAKFFAQFDAGEGTQVGATGIAHLR